MKYFTFTQRQSREYFDGELRVWADVQELDHTSFLSPTAQMTAMADVLEFDDKTGEWHRVKKWCQVEDSREIEIARVNVGDSAKLVPSGWFALRYQEVLPQHLDELVKLNRAIARTIEKYNLRFKYQHDEIAQVVEALQLLGFQYFYNHNDKLKTCKLI